MCRPIRWAGVQTTYLPFWSKAFTVNLRIGDPGPAPTDTAGPLTVNLANGNAHMSFASPTVSTLGGEMGLSFAYNSRQQSNRGLTGRYFDVTPAPGANAAFTFGGRTPQLVRNDASVSFNWGVGSPGPAIPADYYTVQWTGFIAAVVVDSLHDAGLRRRLGVRSVLHVRDV